MKYLTARVPRTSAAALRVGKSPEPRPSRSVARKVGTCGIKYSPAVYHCRSARMGEEGRLERVDGREERVFVPGQVVKEHQAEQAEPGNSDDSGASKNDCTDVAG